MTSILRQLSPARNIFVSLPIFFYDPSFSNLGGGSDFGWYLLLHFMRKLIVMVVNLLPIAMDFSGLEAVCIKYVVAIQISSVPHCRGYVSLRVASWGSLRVVFSAESLYMQNCPVVLNHKCRCRQQANLIQGGTDSNLIHQISLKCR